MARTEKRVMIPFRQFFNNIRKAREARLRDHGPIRFFEMPNEKGKFMVPENLSVDQLFFTQDFVLRQHERANWQDTDPRIRLFAAKFIERMRRLGIPFYVHSAFRTAAEQNEMVLRGVSNTPPPRAAHCQGAAVDLVHSRHHWQLSPSEWAFVGKLGLETAKSIGVPIIWGGDETAIQGEFNDPSDRFRWDPAHWELPGWRKALKPLPPLNPVHMTPRKLLRNAGL